VTEVLEKMFFIRGIGESETIAPENEVVAHLTFEGDPPGALTLRVTTSVARSIAADFLGAEEADLGNREIGEVVCELANMICGSVLSRVESASTFRLASPRIVQVQCPGSEVPALSTGETARFAVGISGGTIAVTFQMEAACQTAEEYAF
jgi:CheY-specific phosphatase CheX